MAHLSTILFFIAGVALVVKGGDMFIDAAGWVSEVTGLSRVVVGATLVSFATTSPEYFVSTIATVKGLNNLSAGNALGSLIANLGIAFAMLAIFTPGKVSDRLFWLKGSIMIVSTCLLWYFCRDGTTDVREGIILLCIFILFTVLNIRFSKDEDESTKRRATNARDIALNIFYFVGGAGAIIMGSNLIVDNGRIIASLLGVSDAVIGLTVVAVGTSLPEIVTSAAAIIKKQNDLSIGNIIGANILDTTLILATGAFISPGGLPLPRSTYTTDIPLTLLLTLLAVIPTAFSGKVMRWQGSVMFLVYASYLVYVVM